MPDKETEASLRDFYGSVFNGGAVNDQKGIRLRQRDRRLVLCRLVLDVRGDACRRHAGRRADCLHTPTTAAQAFREHLAHVLSTVDEQGRTRFGYNQGGEWVDDNLHTIIGTRFYLLHSGDVAFVRQCLPALERMLAYFVQRRDPNGLFKLDDVGAHWYYDAITTSGVNGYYNAFFYKAARDLAEMEHAAGRHRQAREYGELADSIQVGFQPRLLEGRRSRRPALSRLDRRPGKRGQLLLRSCASGRRSPWASLRPSRPARSSPRPTRGSRNWRRSTATRATPDCPPCGRCRSTSIRTLGRRSGDT